MSNERTYAIGDIHGHFDRLCEAHEWIAEDKRQHGSAGDIVHVGDLIDRGPDSAGVVEWLVKGIEAGEPWIVLKGNHDRMMTYFLEGTPRNDPCLRSEYSWLSKPLGGLATMASYGVDCNEDDDPISFHAQARAAVPAAHQTFLAELPLMHQSSGAVFVHAGIKPEVALDDQIEDDLLWIRAQFHNYRRDHGALIVHGHTPIDAVTHYGNRINIDTGVAFGGPLSVIVVEDGVTWNLLAGGRVLVEPQ